MGTFHKAFVSGENIETVKLTIGKYYNIINEEIDDSEQEWRFGDRGSDTIVLSSEFNYNWVAITFYTSTFYFHDELLRRISRDLETEILLGFYQSTSGEGRLARFVNGSLELSINQSYVKLRDEEMHILMHNWGVTAELKTEFSIPEFKERFVEIDRDTIYKFYKKFGLEWDGLNRDVEEYHHLEIKY
ncbi:MAG: hypothetical protein GC192_06075 [Bacteroidetes bacterium]|nr:hypothetical protein [Bacteroidota bacterium]